MKYTKPLLKWVGGKTQIINTLFSHFPKKIKNYHEIFMGGGSVLIALLCELEQGNIHISDNIYAYDINPHVINFYNCVKKYPRELHEITQQTIEIYDSINGTVINRKPTNETEAHTSKESYYYWCRSEFNKIINTDINDKTKKIRYASIFVVLNKLCFRGLYREGPNGFNVPFGHYKKTPDILPEKNINDISILFNKYNVNFIVSGFDSSIKKPVKGDFVYLDPPYAPESSNSFVGYTKDGFTIDDHQRLFDNIVLLEEQEITFSMSNALVPLVTNAFPNDKYLHETVLARRAIHSKNPAAQTVEIIVSNKNM